MSRRDLIDPELRPVLDEMLRGLPGGVNAIADIGARRAEVDAVLARMEVPDNPNVGKQDRVVPGPDGRPDVPVRVYTPAQANGTTPGILYIHGGGMIFGTVDGEDSYATDICDRVGVVVVSVGYRLAPENPYPAQTDDCYAALVWMAENAAELGLDRERLAVYGASAGGGLTIAIALQARDRGGPAVRFMMPIYPMIDDANETVSSREIVDVGVWDRAGNIEAWDWYLGGEPADQYAAPARAEDLSGLPPAFLDVGTVDLFRDESIAFAQRLMQAGVPVELHVHAGAYHAAEMFARDATLSRRIWGLRFDALRRALA